MAFFGKVAEWADRLTPYGRGKNIFLKKPCDKTFANYGGRAFKRIVMLTENIDGQMDMAPALERTLKDIRETLMQPKSKSAGWLHELAGRADELAAELPLCGQRAALDEFAMQLYAEAAQTYRSEGRHKQEFECWEKAIGKMEELHGTRYAISAVDRIQFYRDAVESANKAGLREEARPHADKMVEGLATAFGAGFDSRLPSLGKFAMEAYVVAAQFYHTDGENEYEEGERGAAAAKYRQAFGCWEKAIEWMEELHDTKYDATSAVDRIQFYMWAAGSANKAGLRTRARPYVDRVVEEAKAEKGDNSPAYNGAIMRIVKYLAMLNYGDEAAEICAEMLRAAPAEKVKGALGDIFRISYELEQPEFGKMAMERTLEYIEEDMRRLAAGGSSRAALAAKLARVGEMAAAWREQKFADGYGFSDQETVIASLDFPGKVALMAGAIACADSGPAGVFAARMAMLLAAELAGKGGDRAMQAEYIEKAAGIDMQHIPEKA